MLASHPPHPPSLSLRRRVATVQQLICDEDGLQKGRPNRRVPLLLLVLFALDICLVVLHDLWAGVSLKGKRKGLGEGS